MEVILISRRPGSHGPIRLGRWSLALAMFMVLGLVSAGTYYGFRAGEGIAKPRPSYTKAIVGGEIERQKERIDVAIGESRDHIDALSLRLGQMQAHVIRLDALGTRLAEMGNLEEGEFNFGNEPAQGGRTTGSSLESQSIPDFVVALEHLGRQIDDRAPMLEALEALLMNEQLDEQVHPRGRPVNSGYLSSSYGYRTDPLNGKKAFHSGVDFAGASGSDIVAVAAGVVTESMYRQGMGNMVEIYHGNGYATRYAHNKKNLVEVGAAVRKGQKIAIMGTSGRATGPHVHFEVLMNGETVNPIKYVQEEQ